MGKISISPQSWIFPRPAVIVGTNIDGKPNLMTVAAFGIANVEPLTISVAIRHRRYTLQGIRQNMTFSVNIPSVDLLSEVEYCGRISGSKVNKVEECKFKVFYGKLKSAPLIEQCPVNLECSVAHILNLGSHSFVIGKVDETHISDNCLTDGKPDVIKIKPFVSTGTPGRRYQSLGEFLIQQPAKN